MSRTKGARDRKKRKRRSDFKGRKVFKFYRKPRGHKDTIVLWVWEIREMSHEGYLRWHLKVRTRLHHEVYVPLKNAVITIPVYEIDTEDKFVDTFVNLILREGTFLIKGFSNAKNRYRCKNVSVAKIVIKRNEQGLYGIMEHNYRLWRYWFWQK